MSDGEENVFYEPEQGSSWLAIEPVPGGGKARMVVVMVTSPFISTQFGPQEPTVVLVGSDGNKQPSRIAYPLSMFLAVYTPEIVPCMIRCRIRSAEEQEVRYEYKAADWQLAT